MVWKWFGKKVPWFEIFFPDFGWKPPVFPWFPWLEKVFKNFPEFPDRWEPCNKSTCTLLRVLWKTVFKSDGQIKSQSTHLIVLADELISVCNSWTICSLSLVCSSSMDLVQECRWCIVMIWLVGNVNCIFHWSKICCYHHLAYWVMKMCRIEILCYFNWQNVK